MPATTAPRHSWSPGDVIAGRYRVTHTVGRGAMGAVYGAEHVETGQGVAVKCISKCATATGSDACKECQKTNGFFAVAVALGLCATVGVRTARADASDTTNSVCTMG